MDEATCDHLLANRGYRRVESPVAPAWRSWLWVQPIREHAIPTKLCAGPMLNLSEKGLHALLDLYCELKGEYYSDEDRARNVLRMSKGV